MGTHGRLTRREAREPATSSEAVDVRRAESVARTGAARSDNAGEGAPDDGRERPQRIAARMSASLAPTPWGGRTGLPGPTPVPGPQWRNAP